MIWMYQDNIWCLMTFVWRKWWYGCTKIIGCLTFVWRKWSPWAKKKQRTGLAEIVAELATEVVAATFRPTAGSRHSNHNCTTKLTQLYNMWKERHITNNTDINKIKRIRAAPSPNYLKRFSVRLSSLMSLPTNHPVSPVSLFLLLPLRFLLSLLSPSDH